MKPPVFDILIARFPYGGNGGTSSEHPDVADWLVSTVLKAKQDPRIGRIECRRFSDTPITMTRNAAVLAAQKLKVDFLLMIDSDMGPDGHLLTNPNATTINSYAKPFWESSLDFAAKHYDRGPVVIGSPYCGPPPSECVYVFHWTNTESDDPNPNHRLTMFEREHAATLAGIQHVDALPTGLILYDMRIFNLLPQPWFFYEYEGDGLPCPTCGCRKPGSQASKCSTEDVVLTRDLQMHCFNALGYNPLFCNWDAWSIHHKPKPVGMPRPIFGESVAKKYHDAVLSGRSIQVREVELDGGYYDPDESYDKLVRESVANGKPHAVQATEIHR